MQQCLPHRVLGGLNELNCEALGVVSTHRKCLINVNYYFIKHVYVNVDYQAFNLITCVFLFILYFSYLMIFFSNFLSRNNASS